MNKGVISGSSIIFKTVDISYSYTNTVKQFSDVYRDRPLGPMKTAIYWLEYVIRHKGAPHMRSPAKELNFLQRHSVDVIAFLCLIVYIFYVSVKLLFLGFVKLVKTLINRILLKEDATDVAKKVL